MMITCFYTINLIGKQVRHQMDIDTGGSINHGDSWSIKIRQNEWLVKQNQSWWGVHCWSCSLWLCLRPPPIISFSVSFKSLILSPSASLPSSASQEGFDFFVESPLSPFEARAHTHTRVILMYICWYSCTILTVYWQYCATTAAILECELKVTELDLWLQVACLTKQQTMWRHLKQWRDFVQHVVKLWVSLTYKLSPCDLQQWKDQFSVAANSTLTRTLFFDSAELVQEKQGGGRFTLPPGAEIKTQKKRKLNKEKKKKKIPQTSGERGHGHAGWRDNRERGESEHREAGVTEEEKSLESER